MNGGTPHDNRCRLTQTPGEEGCNLGFVFDNEHSHGVHILP